MIRNLQAVLVLGIAFAGCAPREAYYRPADRRALGRDGYVGAHYRVPPGARDRGAGAVVALGPLVRSDRDANKAEITALLDFRNKGKKTITLLPGSLRLSSEGLGSRKPVAVSKNGRPADGPVEIRYWHRASIAARFSLPAEEALAEKVWTLHWEYRYAGKSYPQKTRFTATDSQLAQRSLSGAPDGLVTGTSYSSSSGVPFLMNIPFVGGLFRGSSEVRSSTVTTVGLGGSRGSARGTWWPLEPERSR